MHAELEKQYCCKSPEIFALFLSLSIRPSVRWLPQPSDRWTTEPRQQQMMSGEEMETDAR